MDGEKNDDHRVFLRKPRRQRSLRESPCGQRKLFPPWGKSGVKAERASHKVSESEEAQQNRYWQTCPGRPQERNCSLLLMRKVSLHLSPWRKTWWMLNIELIYTTLSTLSWQDLQRRETEINSNVQTVFAMCAKNDVPGLRGRVKARIFHSQLTS